jgi:NTE family protein
MTTREMQPQDFTNEVTDLVDGLRTRFGDGLLVSDVLDDEGHQYIDIVMEGGGVLGIALVGYLYVLEQMKIRFLRIGGASAGAISALLLASLGEVREAKSEKLIERLANLDLFSFVDGDEGAKSFIRHLLEDVDDNHPSLFGRLGGFMRTGFKSVGIWDELLRGDLGLNPGVEFHSWLRNTLEQAGTDVTTTSGLKAHLRKVPALRHRQSGNPLRPEQQEAHLALVTADVSTESKVVFPKMAALFWANPDEVSPADYVRASVSVPFFFHPFQLESLERKIEDQETKAKFESNWREWAGYNGKENDGWPAQHLFIDGGIVSNFPIALFHNTTTVPNAPTFGVKLGKDVRKSEIKRLSQLTGAVFNSARHTLDLDFLIRNPDYQHLISEIDTGAHHWLNFELSPEEKIDLFVRGASCADKFLRTFDWQAYKEIRRNLSHAYEASADLKKAKQSGGVALSAAPNPINES